MRKLKRKGAIELSMNFIVVIIISIVIVVGGLALFFKLKANAQSYVDALDSQTEENIKGIMLSNNYRVAVYPSDPTIGSADAKLIGIGITNIYDTAATFSITVSSIDRYDTSNNPVTLPSITLSDYYSITTPTLQIDPHDQKVKGMLLKIPGGSQKGQYVYTIDIEKQTPSPIEPYGKLQVYVNVP